MPDELRDISEKGENWGQVPEFSRYWISSLGRIYNARLHRFIKPYFDDSGYMLVGMQRDDGAQKGKRVHRLVAEAFLPDWNPEWPWTVNHMNGIKSDNRLCNLEMLTTQDNNRHYQTADCFKESRELAWEAISDKLKAKCADPEYHQNMSDRMKTVWQDASKREMYINCLYERQSDPANRKQVSDKLKQICADEEYRKGMSERGKANWQNPEYRKREAESRGVRFWVHNDSHEEWIRESDLDEYLAQGYAKGRLPSHLALSTKGKIRINNGLSDKFVDPSTLDNWLSNGWSLGKHSTKKVKCIQTGQIFNSAEECAKAFNTNIDLIHSRCKGIAKTFRKLKNYTFEYYTEEAEANA